MKKYNGRYYSDGRKIPPEFENIIDDTLLNICDKMVDFCKKYQITPNFITIFRTILGFFTLYYFNFSEDWIFPIFGTTFFYLFDCLDGHLARSTNQVSVIGDYLDHYSDISFYIVLICIMMYKPYDNKLAVLIIILTFTYLSFIHLGLQQKVYKKIRKEIRQENIENKEDYKIVILDEIDEELLDSLNSIHCFKEENILWTKYFGTGTLYLVLIIAIYYIQTHGAIYSIM
jgi:hypothetical protein